MMANQQLKFIRKATLYIMVWLIMAKILSVYLSDYDLELLNNLRQVLNIPEEGRVMKIALKHLGNDHMHNEPASDRVAPELKIEIPAEVRLRAMIKTCIQEAREEIKGEKEKAAHNEKKTAHDKALKEWIAGKGPRPFELFGGSQ
jgi:hypothetical protein